MRISIVAYGTWGDVYPSIRLAQILKNAGYGVQLLVTEDFMEWASNRGLDVRPLAIDKLKVMERVSSQTHPVRVSWAVHKHIRPALIKAGQDLLAEADNTDVLVVNEWLLPMSAGIAQDRELTLIHMAMKPRLPTRERSIPTAPVLPTWFPLRHSYNLLSYRVARLLRWISYARACNDLRIRQLGLPPMGFSDYLGLITSVPSITLVSQHVVPRPKDWADHHHQTGYLFFDDADWRPPGPLVKFLSSEPRPVYVGFGSMHDRDPQATTEIILEALRKTGQRALLHSGWAELGRRGLPDQVYALDYAPHSWLFPRVAASVHHAGAGTTAAALRAGIPSVPVPHSGDQPFWARRAHKLGTATTPIPRSKLNARDLASRIDVALENPKLKGRAERLGIQICEERADEWTVAAFKKILK